MDILRQVDHIILSETKLQSETLKNKQTDRLMIIGSDDVQANREHELVGKPSPEFGVKLSEI